MSINILKTSLIIVVIKFLAASTCLGTEAKIVISEIRGRLVNEQGAPLANTYFSFQPQISVSNRLRTDSQGRINVKPNRPEQEQWPEVKLVPYVHGYAAEPQPIYIGTDGVSQGDYVVKRLSSYDPDRLGTIEAHVSSTGKSLPLNSTVVRFYNYPEFESAQVNAEGVATFRLFPGRYVLSVQDITGFTGEPEIVVVNPGALSRAELKLKYIGEDRKTAREKFRMKLGQAVCGIDVETVHALADEFQSDLELFGEDKVLVVGRIIDRSGATLSKAQVAICNDRREVAYPAACQFNPFFASIWERKRLDGNISIRPFVEGYAAEYLPLAKIHDRVSWGEYSLRKLDQFPQQELAVLRGKVATDNGSLPDEELKVKLGWGASLGERPIDEQGRFEFTLYPGKYCPEVWAYGYTTSGECITLEANKVGQINLVLKRRTGKMWNNLPKAGPPKKS